MEHNGNPSETQKKKEKKRSGDTRKTWKLVMNARGKPNGNARKTQQKPDGNPTETQKKTSENKENLETCYGNPKETQAQPNGKPRGTQKNALLTQGNKEKLTRNQKEIQKHATEAQGKPN